MSVTDEIIAARDGGIVHCGVSRNAKPPLTELAKEFGLRAEPKHYREIDAEEARRLIQLLLHRDLAYCPVIMPAALAVEMADQFFAQFGTHAKYFTNGIWDIPNPEWEQGRFNGSFNPVTAATFDTGVLVLGESCSGCLWVEDED